MIPAGELTGAILAGGHSRRMGRDKAELRWQGTPLWARQVALLREIGATRVGVVRRSDQPPLPLPPDIACWHDTVVEAGPLAGLQTALDACETDWLAVVAVDLPQLDAAWFSTLARVCAPGHGAIGRRPDGFFEPLAAIYPRGALAEVERRLASDDRSLQSLAAALLAQNLMAVVDLTAAGLARLANWNSPADIPPS